MRLILLLGIACFAFAPFDADAQISIDCSEFNELNDPSASSACEDDFAVLEALAPINPNFEIVVRATRVLGQRSLIKSINLSTTANCLLIGSVSFFPFTTSPGRSITIFADVFSDPPVIRARLSTIIDDQPERLTPFSERQIPCQTVAMEPVEHEPCPEDPFSEGIGFAPRLVCDPILLDFGAFGFDLTGAADGVSFDIDADGTPDSVSWTQGGSLDAFLALDRNGNGIVDDGGELFGNATPLVDGTLAPHGYAALGELDLPAQGGNGNGYIDRADRIYPDLLLWTDTNHDGVSDRIEITTLESRGVIAIRTEPRKSPATDEHGNRFSLVSLAYLKTRVGTRTILTSDVSFTTLSSR